MGFERLNRAKQYHSERKTIRRREELPPEIVDKFAELPEEEGGGFVEREFLECYDEWEKRARENNEKRSALKKIFMIGKVDAYSLLRREAASALYLFHLGRRIETNSNQ